MAITFSANTGTASYKASVRRSGRKLKSWERLQRWAASKRGEKFKIGGPRSK